MDGRSAHRSITWRKFLGLAGLGTLLIGTGGCAMSSTAPTNLTMPSTMNPLARIELAGARTEWAAGSSAPSYLQSTYFHTAAVELARAIGAGVNDASSFQSSLEELRQLATLPETNDSPAQRSQARQDLRALNTFFNTKRLYE
jgi:hypothetical protein